MERTQIIKIILILTVVVIVIAFLAVVFYKYIYQTELFQVNNTNWTYEGVMFLIHKVRKKKDL